MKRNVWNKTEHSGFPNQENAPDRIVPPKSFAITGDNIDEIRSVLTAIVESSDDAIIGISLDGVVMTWNRGAELAFGYRAHEIIGKSITILYPPSKLAQEAIMLDRIRRGERLDHYETTRRRKDGKEIDVSVTISPIRDATGRILGASKIARDISHRKHNEAILKALNERLEQELKRRTREQELVEEQLRQSQKMEAIGQLTGGIAHDFNNLLTIISGNLEVLDNQLGTENSRAHRLIDAARQGASRAARLTGQLLAFARQQPLLPEIVGLNDLLGEFWNLIVRAVGETIEARLDCDLALLPCRVDPAQFQSAILNLVVNARDAMPDGGKLMIKTRSTNIEHVQDTRLPDIPPGSYVCVSVHDTGHGIPPELIDKIFDPFFTTKEVGKGTGLGLSQVFGFVRQSEGTVDVESKIGHGTIFRILLPAVTASEMAPAEREEAAMSGDLPRGTETVLVVEDEAAILELLRNYLDDLGYRVLAARNANEAIEILRSENDIHLLLTDLVLPLGMGGIELARHAQTLHPGIKVLLISGYDRVADAVDFPLLSKPFRQNELAQEIRAILEHRTPAKSE